MLIDAQDLETDSILKCDVCIVGAGASGITVARRLGGTSLEVVVLEGGGLTEDPEHQALNDGSSDGLPYFDLDRTRWRVLGGSTGRWAGWCRRLDPLDVDQRPWVGATGWPIGYDVLESYYAEAEEICQLPDRPFDTTAWRDSIPDLYKPPFVAGDLRAVVWKGSPPTKFGTVYRDDLESAQSVRVVYHANVVELDTNDDGKQVTVARARTLEGKGLEVEAKVFIVAADAIETARLLLASRRVHRDGLGNANGNVGRHFMEHPHGITGRLVLAPQENGARPMLPALDLGLKGAKHRINLQRPSGGIKVGYGTTADTQRERELLNYSAHLQTTTPGATEPSEAYQSLRLLFSNFRSIGRLARQIRNRTVPRGAGEHLKNVMLHLPEVTRAVNHEMLRRPTELAVYTQAEQTPNPESRVTLTDERDRLGMPKVRLTWRMTRQDKASIRVSQQVLSNQLEASGVGRIEEPDWLIADDDEWGPAIGGGHHHMGTTRMASEPRHGVVDTNGKVHGVANLYVTDGAVFPTGGFANPLLTIVALALRTGDIVRRRLRGG